MLDVTMYTGMYATGRTYQAVMDAIVIASRLDDKIPVVALTDDPIGSTDLNYIYTELNLTSDDVDVILTRGKLYNMDEDAIQELELALPVEMILVVDLPRSLDDYLKTVIDRLRPRLHRLSLIVDQKPMSYDESDLYWPSGYHRSKYNVSKRLCTRDVTTGDYHVVAI